MKSWDLFKALIGNAGFYKKRLLFFVALMAVGLGFFAVWYKIRGVEASVDFSSRPSGYSDEVKLDIVVTKEAEVLIDNQKNNNAIKFYPDFDEVRLIVFDSPGYFVKDFQAVLHLPEQNAQSVKPIIYAVHGVGSYKTSIPDAETIVYQASDVSPQSTLTIVAELPKGMVTPDFGQNVGYQIGVLPLKIWLYIGIILPLMTIVFLLYMIIKRRSAQILFVGNALSKPPSADPPPVVGVLVDGTVGAREIAATLIDLARRGFILIINKGKNQFSFGKKRSGDFQTMTDLRPFEKVLLDKIFLQSTIKSTLNDVEMRIGRHIFSRKIAQFYLGVYNFATDRGFFRKNPAKVHLGYKYTGIALLFLSLVGFGLTAATGADPKFSLIFWVSGMVAAYFIIKLSPYLPARSELGTGELKKWLAFRKFLVSRGSLPANMVLQAKFEEFLPYAVVLGSEVEWASRFMREPFTKPEWYESAERVVVLENFMGEFLPFIGYVAENLAKSHEPTVE